MNCLCIAYSILVSIILTFVYFKFLHIKRRTAIFNIYQVPSCFYWLKVFFMFSVISLRQWRNRQKKCGPTPAELDRSQPLSYHKKSIDGVYFNAANEQGDYLVVGLARRKEKLCDTFLVLKVAKSGLGVLVGPKFPDTSLYKSEENDDFSVDSLIITPIEPMKTWKLTYNGKMKKESDSRHVYEVQINLNWTSNLPFFNFDTDMDPLLTAKYIALERWSTEFFKILQDAHQTHYEQFGQFTGTATIDGTTYELQLDSCRDHSFGKKRYWGMFHRYGLHYVSTENGDRFAILNISAPIIGSDMVLGYVYSSIEKKCYPLQSCDLLLYQHGEDGIPPNDYAFSFTANNRHYTMQINVVDSPYFFMSKEWDAKIWERLCTSTVNGIKGWGISEWEYRNVAGRTVSG